MLNPPLTDHIEKRLAKTLGFRVTAQPGIETSPFIIQFLEWPADEEKAKDVPLVTAQRPVSSWAESLWQQMLREAVEQHDMLLALQMVNKINREIRKENDRLKSKVDALDAVKENYHERLAAVTEERNTLAGQLQAEVDARAGNLDAAREQAERIDSMMPENKTGQKVWHKYPESEPGPLDQKLPVE